MWTSFIIFMSNEFKSSLYHATLCFLNALSELPKKTLWVDWNGDAKMQKKSMFEFFFVEHI